MFLRRARWVTDKYILLMMGVFPLFVGFRLHAYTAITRAKFLFFVIATGVWLVSVAALLLIGAARGERYPITIRPAHIAMAAFLAFGAISAAFSEYGAVCLIGADRYDGYLSTVLYGAIFFGVSLLAEPRPRYAWALGASAAVCSGIVLLQLYGLDPFRLYPEGTNYYDKYALLNSAFLGTLGNAGVTSAYLCLAAPILVIYPVLSEEQRDGWLLLPGAMALAALALCDVDAGVVAAAGCALVSVPMAIRNRRISRIAGAAAGGCAAAGLAALYFWPGTSGTLWEMSQVLHGRLSDSFGSSRGQIWKQGWTLFLEKPWLGGGPGTTSLRFDIRWTRYVEEIGRERVAKVSNAHNVYLGYLLNIGLLGTLSYLAAAVCSFVTWARRRALGALYPALGAALVCYMIQDFFGLGLCLSEPMLFVIWGLLESGQPSGE